jgi:RNA polymerase sigma factor for flagellar operon FliA
MNDTQAAPDRVRTERLKAYRQAEGTRTTNERDQEVLRHLPLVQTVVERLCAGLPRSVDKDDLFHAGVIGLIDALNRYDASRDTAFSTYAVLRIRGQIIDELRDRDWVPRGVRERARAYQQAVTDLHGELGRMPSDTELARRLGVPEDELDALAQSTQLVGQVSLESPTGEDGELGDALAKRDDESADPSRHLEADDRRQVLARLLATLSEQDRLVVKLYYFENLLMKEIAEILGVTESRICQIHSRVIALLRARVGDALAL